MLSWLVQPCLTVARAHVTLREPLESLGRASSPFPPDPKGNFSSQLKVWICMLGVGILNLFPVWKPHCDKSPHLFLLTRSQVGKPVSADRTGNLGTYFCERSRLAPCLLSRYSGSDLAGEGLLSRAYKVWSWLLQSWSREGFPWLIPVLASSALSCPGQHPGAEWLIGDLTSARHPAYFLDPRSWPFSLAGKP